jgi:hypothetical protein
MAAWDLCRLRILVDDVYDMSVPARHDVLLRVNHFKRVKHDDKRPFTFEHYRLLL